MSLIRKEKRLIIHSSWGTYLGIFLIPLYLLVLDTLSALWTHSEVFSRNIINVAILFFLLLLISGTRILIISDKTIKYWPQYIFKKDLPINDIKKINVTVDTHYSTNTVLLPVETISFLDNKSRQLIKLNLRVFSKGDICRFLSKVVSLNSQIELNKYAKELIEKHDESIQREVKNTYFYALRVISIMFFLGLLILGIVFLIQK